ncbi:hypothetical protein GCM10022223_32670 [Kineosporia mesophila]|uniref:Uncharacterized protein n=1 Tax=Kineosporia mesophila TaxID=566012 RepID=A0ABP6ZN36_9ACTN|nr:hypothetical protein [Kineosporia mesophila]MCD5353735.1 hypothetical protein [Kineosporia mesophila]
MEAPKISSADLLGSAEDAIESAVQEVLADDWVKFVKSGLTLDPRERYERIAAALGGS